MSRLGTGSRLDRPAGGRGPPTRPVRVLAVDDQEPFRRALRDMIAATPGFEVAGEAASGAEAVELAGALAPDLVLLDVRMPGMDGLETARRLRSAHPAAVVVLISLDATVDDPAAVGAVAHLRKQELSIAALRELWGARRRR